MSRNVTLVLVTLPSCPACVKFKKEIFPDLKNKINKSGVADFLYFDLPFTGGIPKNYNTQLKVDRVPALFISDTESWNDHKNPLKAEQLQNIFNPNLYSEIEKKVKELQPIPKPFNFFSNLFSRSIPKPDPKSIPAPVSKPSITPVLISPWSKIPKTLKEEFIPSSNIKVNVIDSREKVQETIKESKKITKSRKI